MDTAGLILSEELKSHLSKIRKGKLYRRQFSIPQNMSCIRWESMKKRGTESKILAG
jgi:hypothetical protein